MSAQTMYEAFAPAEAVYKAQVMADTWGHLAAKKNKTYQGVLVFAVGIFGSDDLNPTALHCEFRAGEDELNSSPWFFDAMADFIGSLKCVAGGVYRFDGTFRNYRFKGKVSTIMQPIEIQGRTQEPNECCKISSCCRVIGVD